MEVVERYLKTVHELNILWEQLQTQPENKAQPQQVRALQDEVQRIWNEEICTSPEAAFELLGHFLKTSQRGWHFSYLVDYVAENKLEEIFTACLPALLFSDDQAKENGLELQYFCLDRLQWQMPELFYPHLAAMWASRSPFWEGWWDSGKLGMNVILSALEGKEKETPDLTCSYIQAALERTNCPEAFDWLRENYGLNVLSDYAGVEYRDSQWRRLYFADSYHFVFPPEFRQHPNWPDHLKPTHPTWLFPAEVGSARLFDRGFPEWQGNMPEYRVELLKLPPGIAVTLPVNLTAPEDTAPSEAHVQLDGTSFPSDWDEEDIEIFMEDNEGDPLALNPFMGAEFIPIRFARTPKRWYRQPDEYQQNRAKLGGMGAWRQFRGEYNQGGCSRCGQLVPLLLQLGADGLRSPSGMTSIFWCDQCRTATTISTHS